MSTPRDQTAAPAGAAVTPRDACPLCHHPLPVHASGYCLQCVAPGEAPYDSGPATGQPRRGRDCARELTGHPVTWMDTPPKPFTGAQRP